MSLKAGRVGVNPVDVDPISGHISPSSVDAYTKAQADDKFLSKTDASSTYESKSDASTAHNQLQPKTLVVPISMLEGSQLVPKTTVEAVIQTMNNAMTNADLTELIDKKVDKNVRALSSSDDLDDVKDIGIYSVTTSPTHAPSGVSYCSMLVLPIASYGGLARQQVLIEGENVYIRKYTGSPIAWESWIKYQGTIVS